MKLTPKIDALIFSSLLMVFLPVISFIKTAGASMPLKVEEPPLSISSTLAPAAYIKSNYYYESYEATQVAKEFKAIVTAYNTVAAQTDNTPCIAAANVNICERNDVVACPREYPLGSIFIIDNRQYICLDRTSLKYDGRFDISFDKDVEGAIKFGKQELTIKFIK